MCTPAQGSCWRGPGCTWAGRVNRSTSSARCRCATSCRAWAQRNRNWPPAAATSPRKFAEALSLARPLASVNDEALQRVHPGQQTEYRYKFSEIPFAGQPVADALFEVLRNNPRIDQATKDNYHRSLSDEDSVTRVDIFGSYPNYSPLAFDSVLKPAAAAVGLDRRAGPRDVLALPSRAPVAGVTADDR